MRTISNVLVAVLVSMCTSEDAVECTAHDIPDGDDDRCELLQAGVGIVSHSEGHPAQLEQAATVADGKIAQKSWPDDLVKGIAGIVGGVDKLEGDFDAVKTAVATFTHAVHEAIHDLTKRVNPKMNLDSIIAQVDLTLKTIHEAAKKVFEVLTKTTTEYMTTVGKLTPEKFRNAMKAALDNLSQQAKLFSNSFEDAATELKSVNRTAVCEVVKQNLDSMHKKVEAFISSATGLSTKNLNKEILSAKDALPEALKKEVDKILAKANEAAEHIMSSMSSTMQEISMGIAQALKGHCEVLSRSTAGRLEVSLLLTFVIGLRTVLL